MLEKQNLKNFIAPVATGISHLKIVFVNAYFVDTPENGAVTFRYFANRTAPYWRAMRWRR